MAFEDYFSVQVFFVIFRETMETAVIVSVLLAFIKQGFSEKADQKLYNRLVAQVWIGALIGLLLCIIVGVFIIFAFYRLGTNLWDVTEKLWEATFSILASGMITVMGIAMLRINKMQAKWKVKIANAIIETHEGRGGWGIKHLSRKYAMALLPMVTTLREGLEAVVFLGGIGVSQPASSFPIPVITATILGLFVGYLMYSTGNHVSIHYFLVGSTCFLYLIAAGLISRGVWLIELQQFLNKVGQDVSETGSGPGSYDINNVVWHVNCCNSQTDGWWMIFNSILGWQNTATYGSIISYNLYWAFVIAMIFAIKYKEENEGYLPVLPRKWQKPKVAKHLTFSEAERNELVSRATLLYSSTHGGAGDVEQDRESVDSTTPLVRH